MNSKPSYRKIDYTLRPAKNIERKMIAEACFRLAAFQPINTYRYIGFGSPFFSDFRLFHRLLGFESMVNIEAEESDTARFNFNRPYDCVKMVYGRSSDVLPTLEWKGLPTVAWLDYDSKLTLDILDDIRLLTAQLETVSLLIITLRRKPKDFGTGSQKIDALRAEFGESLPPGIRQKDMTKGRFPETLRRIIKSSIEDELMSRNIDLTAADQVGYKQIFNFRYSDGTPMLTLGGLFSRVSDQELLFNCGFDSLGYCREGSEPYNIVAPLITFKEQKTLDSQLPGTSVCLPGLQQNDVEEYSRVYRYFPAFTEAEL